MSWSHPIIRHITKKISTSPAVIRVNINLPNAYSKLRHFLKHFKPKQICESSREGISVNNNVKVIILQLNT